LNATARSKRPRGISGIPGALGGGESSLGGDGGGEGDGEGARLTFLFLELDAFETLDFEEPPSLSLLFDDFQYPFGVVGVAIDEFSEMIPNPEVSVQVVNKFEKILE
jgi:hypothetical protein